MTTTANPKESSGWATWWLLAAGIYNLLWGSITIAFPDLLFDLVGAPRVNYPEIWQCVGMIVGVYGIGYLIAASDPRRHWPIVLVGLLGKIFGPIGFVSALLRGTFPAKFGWTILTNDLIWWVPFALILLDAWRHRQPAQGFLLRFVKETKISAPQQVVFAFHESKDALTRLIPPWEKMEVVKSSGSLLPGSRVILRGKLLGLLPVRWVAEHTEYDPPRLFADRQVSGPFAFWYHHHHILPGDHGSSILRDEVEYRVPMGALGYHLGARFTQRQLQRMFDYRHEVTRRLIESGEWKPEPA